MLLGAQSFNPAVAQWSSGSVPHCKAVIALTIDGDTDGYFERLGGNRQLGVECGHFGTSAANRPGTGNQTDQQIRPA